ncbi:flagellar hook assembly protein FlgD [Rhodobium gokarnense]|uniref:Basal-body rod modification protein FlgD n=1 Tax=Rhodobium gokarnense TaxID=364296 RepID=A0ABT3H5L3_9HYPH|nr:flagellar hook capping FlgD N-terminal domain-containing protein [Rhodobium gokarnense]MCW2305693.1 flagellar basal-body rod modification protein FlgD [Rhodobium gokarnense]
MSIDPSGATSSVANLASRSSASTSQATKDATSLADNYEMFLELLTVQLQNQNPLEPMDADKFAEQLTQYSSVEQQIKTNEHLENIISGISASSTSALVSYIGKTIEATGETTVLRDGSAAWTYDVKTAATATVTITNSAGAAVYTDQVSLEQGGGAFVWNGQTTSGRTVEDGEYTINIEAEDAAGNAVTVSTALTGVVDEVDMSGGEAVLKIGDIKVPVGNVTAIRDAS